MIPADISSVLEKHNHEFHPVVQLNETKDKIVALDLSWTNAGFTEAVYQNTDAFSAYINELLAANHAKFLIGGYREHREMYRRSRLFDHNLAGFEDHHEEARSIHLGTDIWGAAGTTVFAPLGGMVHSFAFNNHPGDYGVTIILQHQIKTINFYTLYGHLAMRDIANLRKGRFVSRGENFAHFGSPAENGDWPPHLHFQLIIDLGNYEGDYPGVCKMSEATKYLKNCPDPELILKMKKYI